MKKILNICSWGKMLRGYCISPKKGISPPKAEIISFSGISPSRVSGEVPGARSLFF